MNRRPQRKRDQGRPYLIGQLWRRTGDNPQSGILARIEETSGIISKPGPGVDPTRPSSFLALHMCPRRWRARRSACVASAAQVCTENNPGGQVQLGWAEVAICAWIFAGESIIRVVTGANGGDV